jgi:hypothetical protein
VFEGGFLGLDNISVFDRCAPLPTAGTLEQADGTAWMCLLFYEYFHADHGAGLGASHQTGWTGLVGDLVNLFGGLDPAAILAEGKIAALEAGRR